MVDAYAAAVLSGLRCRVQGIKGKNVKAGAVGENVFREHESFFDSVFRNKTGFFFSNLI